MIPRLSQTPSLDPIVSAYLESLRTQNFSGDIASSYSDRLSLATDNSVYQQLPQALLFPKSIADVVILTKLAQKPEFSALTFTPRGGNGHERAIIEPKYYCGSFTPYESNFGA